MRRSEAMACRTLSTSAPNRSQTFAISFMNEMRVASIAFAAYLAQLGARAVHHHDRRAGPRERPVQLRHDLGAARVVGANHHAVGLQEVLDGRALLQELRIAHDAERVASSRCGWPSRTSSDVPAGTVLLSTMTL